jgi:hypothetical protein
MSLIDDIKADIVTLKVKKEAAKTRGENEVAAIEAQIARLQAAQTALNNPAILEAITISKERGLV